jgi:hypothetical protein
MRATRWKAKNRGHLKLPFTAASAQLGVSDAGIEDFRERLVNLTQSLGLTDFLPALDPESTTPSISPASIPRIGKALDLATRLDDRMQGDIRRWTIAVDALIRAVHWKAPVKAELRNQDQASQVRWLLDELGISYTQKERGQSLEKKDRPSFPVTYDLDIDFRQIQVAVFGVRILLDLLESMPKS